MKRFLLFISVIIFFGILMLFLMLGFALPDNETSTVEGRALAQRPVTDLSDMKTLTSNWSDYAVDQFPFREKLLKAYSALELAQNKYFTRNTFVINNSWIMTYIYNVSDSKYQAVVRAIEGAANITDAAFIYAVIPQKNDMLADLAIEYMDNTISENNKRTLMEMLGNLTSVATIDLGDYFLSTYTLEQRMQMYYRTDFHWNSYGAFLAAEYISQEMARHGLIDKAIIPTITDFYWTDLGMTHLYQGDLNRRFSNLFPLDENIPYFSLNEKAVSFANYYMSTDNTHPVDRSSIISSGLNQDILDYNDISTDNLGYYRVENPNARTNQHILILKDSFQNPTIDYWTELFTEVTVIDPRSYTTNHTFSELLEQNGIDIVLLMYHQNNASEELVEFLT